MGLPFLNRGQAPRKTGGAVACVPLGGMAARFLFGAMLLPDREKGPDWNVRRRQRILEEITEREMELIRLVCDSGQYTYKAIAEQMGIGVNRVEEICKNLKRKFDLLEKASLVRFATAWGLVPGYPWDRWLDALDAGTGQLEGEEAPYL